ncbi:MAG TPA: hypothetical protein PKD61_33870, partial [Polyangiaceae bacterium]|nr:hypothetical protein [Polyangiaceae bacterium]
DLVHQTLNAAAECGFPEYFGAITGGVLEHDVNNDWLHQPGAQITKQHISMLSDPYLRAAIAEKWSAGLSQGETATPCPTLDLGQRRSSDALVRIARRPSPGQPV